jgi:outer membrane biosynthesis protein TonB
MNAATSPQEQPLHAQIDEAQAQLGGLEQSLHAIDGELGRLATQREQYELLAQACGSLEKLAALGVGELFWGDNVDRSAVARHVHGVRLRVNEFGEQIAQIENRRQAVVDEIAQGREVLAILEDDLFEVREAEEEARNEWVIERDVEPTVARAAAMPWTRGGEDDRRFRSSLGSSLAAAMLLGFLLPLIDLPLPEPAEILEVPERVVELIRRDQRRPVPPPPPLLEERPEEPVPPPEPEPEPLVAEQPPPEPTAAPAQEPAPQPEAPRQRAQQSGLLAFRESFSTLAENRPAARLGAGARISNSGDAAIGRPERAMVTTQAPGSSGGINLASLSRDVGGDGGGGGSQMAGVETTRVASSIGPGGGGGRPVGAGDGTGGAVAGRTDEEIQIVFDRYKASLYRLYNRELRNDPTLRGQMVLRLTIEPSGVVSFIELQSTDMNSPTLVQQVLERVRTFDFGAKDVAAITIVYPIDFLPAA